MYRRLSCAVLLAAFVAVSRPVSAQSSPLVEISAGYQYALDLADFDEIISYRNGLFGSAAVYLVGPLAVVGEWSQSSNIQEVGESGRFGPVERRAVAPMGGVRLGHGKFVQAMIGQIALTTTRELLTGTSEITTVETAWQIGAGFSFGIAGPVSGRVLIDYRSLLNKDVTSFGKQIRVGVGGAYAFGNR